MHHKLSDLMYLLGGPRSVLSHRKRRLLWALFSVLVGVLLVGDVVGWIFVGNGGYLFLPRWSAIVALCLCGACAWLMRTGFRDRNLRNLSADR